MAQVANSFRVKSVKNLEPFRLYLLHFYFVKNTHISSYKFTQIFPHKSSSSLFAEIKNENGKSLLAKSILIFVLFAAAIKPKFLGCHRPNEVN